MWTLGDVLKHKEGHVTPPQVKRWEGTKPTVCDVCHRPFTKDVFYDAATRMGPWGLLCDGCFQMHGIGLGTGRGQKYDLTSRVKLEG